MNIFEKYPASAFLKSLPEDSDFFRLRARIIDLFTYLDGLEDSNFQLDQDPHARLWEMMVAKILKVEGYEPKRKCTAHGPDFVVEKDGRRIFIEAVCPGPGVNAKPNSIPPIIHGASVAQKVPVDQIVLRLCSALKDKKEKYEQYLAHGIVSPSDFCIIALSSSKLSPRANLSSPAILRATHGLGNYYGIFGSGEGETDEGFASCESIQKVSGAPVDTKFFLSGDNSVISAVLYSESSFFSLDLDLFVESMIIHNPKTGVSLPQECFKQIDQMWTICCENDSGWRAYRKEGLHQMAGVNAGSEMA